MAAVAHNAVIIEAVALARAQMHAELARVRDRGATDHEVTSHAIAALREELDAARRELEYLRALTIACGLAPSTLVH